MASDDVKSGWRPSASIETLRKRAALVQSIRIFFERKGYLEVDTPVMARFGVTDVHLENIQAYFRDTPFYLQTSPEYHMKRLLAAGSGPIFQLAHAFRDDELGRLHNPEFSILEWYQLDIDHHALIAEIDELLGEVLACEPLMAITYQDAFIQSCQVDPFDTNVQELQRVLQHYDLSQVLSKEETEIDAYLFLLMSHVVEPWLSKKTSPVAVYDFPPSQAALAKIKNQKASRFEIFYKGIELANGFHELTDANIQMSRFRMDNQKRKAHGILEKEPDARLIQALQHGLPHCSGVALGVDRLLAIQLNCFDISKLMAFNIHDA